MLIGIRMDNDHWSDEPLDLGVRGTFKQNHDTENTQRGAERNSLFWSGTCTCFSWWCPCFCAGPMPPIPSFFRDDWHGFSLGSSYWISKQGLGGPIKDDHTASTWNPESGIWQLIFLKGAWPCLGLRMSFFISSGRGLGECQNLTCLGNDYMSSHQQLAISGS